MSQNLLRYIDYLRKVPTSVTPGDFVTYGHPRGIHESTLRAWITLKLTTDLLRKGMPAEFVADIAEAIMEWDPKY